MFLRSAPKFLFVFHAPLMNRLGRGHILMKLQYNRNWNSKRINEKMEKNFMSNLNCDKVSRKGIYLYYIHF